MADYVIDIIDEPLLFTKDMEENDAFKVIIIGGGLAGSLLANGLSEHAIDFVVYERDAEDSATRDGY